MSPAAALEIDARGWRCPRPVIELAQRIDEVEVGEVVTVVCTDVAARYDVPAWCRMRGQEHLGESVADDGALALHVRRLS